MRRTSLTLTKTLRPGVLPLWMMVLVIVGTLLILVQAVLAETVDLDEYLSLVVENSRALKQACVNRWNRPASQPPTPNAKIM